MENGENMKWINYHHLIYFKEIADQGSISKASEKLRVGQPALSTQLKGLEEYLGVKLFERKNRKLFLTEAGKVVLEYAKRISNLGKELIEVIDDKAYTQKIHLSVGSLDSIPKHLVCNIVDFAHKKTKCFLSILEGSSEVLMRELITHHLDIVIADHEMKSFESNTLYCKKIFQKKIMAFASPDYKYLKKDFPYSLNNTSCIVPTSHSRLRSHLDHYFHLHKIKPSYIAETQDSAVQKILATKGDGVIFLSDFSTKDLIQNKSLIKIGTLKGVKASYYLVYNKRLIENPALELVLKQDFNKIRPR